MFRSSTEPILSHLSSSLIDKTALISLKLLLSHIKGPLPKAQCPVPRVQRELGPRKPPQRESANPHIEIALCSYFCQEEATEARARVNFILSFTRQSVAALVHGPHEDPAEHEDDEATVRANTRTATLLPALSRLVALQLAPKGLHSHSKPHFQASACRKLVSQRTVRHVRNIIRRHAQRYQSSSGVFGIRGRAVLEG